MRSSTARRGHKDFQGFFTFDRHAMPDRHEERGWARICATTLKIKGLWVNRLSRGPGRNVAPYSANVSRFTRSADAKLRRFRAGTAILLRKWCTFAIQRPLNLRCVLRASKLAIASPTELRHPFESKLGWKWFKRLVVSQHGVMADTKHLSPEAAYCVLPLVLDG